MDPNAVLHLARTLSTTIVNARDSVDEELQTRAEDLAEAFLNLDEWLTKGGVLPSAWQPKPADAWLRDAYEVADRAKELDSEKEPS